MIGEFAVKVCPDEKCVECPDLAGKNFCKCVGGMERADAIVEAKGLREQGINAVPRKYKDGWALLIALKDVDKAFA